MFVNSNDLLYIPNLMFKFKKITSFSIIINAHCTGISLNMCFDL